MQGDSSPLARLASIRPSESEARALRMYREAAAAELYAHYAPLAEAGSAHAQYELSRLYLFCTISPTDETMALYEKDPRYDAKLEQYRKNHVRCAGFREVAGATDDLEQPMREWLRKASESGSPLARFELEVADCMNEVGPYARENAAAGSQSFSARRVPSQQLVYDVLTYARGHEDPRVRYLSVRQAMFYFVWFVENERYLGEFNFDRTAGHVKRPPLSEAWRLLGCASSANCSLEERLESIARNYYSYEIHEIVATTLDLHSAIWQGDWSRLGYPQAEGRAPISLLPAPRRFKAAP
ncbi:MAG: hypothetical protein AAFY29_08630 [Pseudomonadota bacterium]